MCVTTTFGVINPKSGVSSLDNLPSGTELALEGTLGCATGTVLVLYLLTFKFVNEFHEISHYSY